MLVTRLTSKLVPPMSTTTASANPADLHRCAPKAGAAAGPERTVRAALVIASLAVIKPPEEEITKSETDRFRLKEAEYRKKLEDAQKSNEELTRKLEQGSQQLQGEVFELELENILRQAFPHDILEPVR